MRPLSSALPLPYVLVRVTRGSLVAHRHLFAPPRCRTSQYRITFVPSRCLFGTILVTLCMMVWDWRTSRAEPMLSCWHDLLFLFLSRTILSFSSFNGLVVWGWGLWTDSVLTLPAFPAFNNNNNIFAFYYLNNTLLFVVFILNY